MATELLGALLVRLGLDSAEFNRNLGKAKVEMSTFDKAMAGVGKTMKAVQAGFAALIGLEAINQFRQAGRAAIDASGGLGELAAQLGVTTDALQEYRFIATQVGVEQGEMEKSLAKLTKTIGEAGMGAKGPAEAFKTLGVNIRDTEGKIRATDLIVRDIADGIAKIDDPATQAALATDLFGKAGQKLMPLLQGGSAEIKKFADEAHKLGIILNEETIAATDELADELAKRDKVFEMRWNAELVKRGDSIASIEKYWQDMKLAALDGIGWLDEQAKRIDDNAAKQREELLNFGSNFRAMLGDIGRWLGDWWEGVKQRFRNFVAFVASIPETVIGHMRRMVEGVRTWLVSRLGATLDWLAGKLKWAGDLFFQLYDRVVGHSYIPDMVDEIGQHMRRLDAELVTPAKDATSKAEQAFRDLQARLRGIMADLFPEVADRLEHEETLKTINDALDAQKKKGADLVEIERQRLALLTAAERKYLGLDRDRMAVGPGEQAPEVEVVDGTKKIEDINDDILGRADEVFGKVGKSADAMRVKVVESFAGMVNGAMQELDRFVRGIKSGNWLDVIGGLLSAIDQISGIVTQGKGFNLGSFEFGNTGSLAGARADGGPVTAGRSYLVGERGEEIFTPSTSGTIIANDQLGGGIATIVPSPYFDVVVDGRIQRAGPTIAQAGSVVAQQNMQRASTRRVA